MKYIQITQEDVQELAKEMERSKKKVAIRFDSITLGRDEQNLYDQNQDMEVILCDMYYADKETVAVGICLEYPDSSKEWVYYRPHDHEAIKLYNEIVSQLGPKTQTYYQNIDGSLTSFIVTEIE